MPWRIVKRFDPADFGSGGRPLEITAAHWAVWAMTGYNTLAGFMYWTSGQHNLSYV